MHLGILKDTARVGLLTILAKVAGAFKTVVVARFFGAGNDLDAYLAAFLIPSFLGDVLAGALTQALMPVLFEIRHSQGAKEEQRLCSTVLFTATGALLASAIAAALCAGPLVALTGSGFDPAKMALTRQMLFLMLPILPLSGVNVTLRTILNSRGHFSAAAATPMLTPLASIAALLLFWRQWGILTLALGTTGGALIESAALCWATIASGGRLPFAWMGFDAGSRRVWSEYIPVASSSLLLGGSNALDQAMAAMLGPGSVSALNYGTRLTVVLLAAGPASLATTVFPRLSKLAAEGDWTQFRASVFAYGRLSLGATIPIALALIVSSEPLVRLFFQRGAFTAADSRLIAGVQAASLAQIPFAVLLMLLLRVVSSLRENRLLIRVAALSLAANLVLNLLLMRWLGVAGIALSTAGVQAITLAFLLTWSFRRLAVNGKSTM